MLSLDGSKPNWMQAIGMWGQPTPDLGAIGPLAGICGGLTAPTDLRQKATGTSGGPLLFRVPAADHRRGSSAKSNPLLQNTH